MLMPRQTASLIWRSSSTVQMLQIFKELEIGALMKHCTMPLKSSSQVSTTIPSSRCATSISKSTAMQLLQQERPIMSPLGRPFALLVYVLANSVLLLNADLKLLSIQTTLTKLSVITLILDTSLILYHSLSKDLVSRMRISEFSQSWESCTQSTSPRKLWSTARFSFPNSMCLKLFVPANVHVYSHLLFTFTCRIKSSTTL
mmetsp:Transcript_16160/g.30538  ORF Transcript_16160/g.30538 Transcript_16160/m.30538 type:complete len:201 (-) Transcript_16160:1007-1609(-)